MNFKPEITEFTLNENVFSRRVTENVQGDIIVPDTKGDIGKILQTDAVAVIDSKEISGGRATVSGTVYVNVLYAPQDGGLDSMSTSMSFSHTLKAESDDIYLLADCCVKSVEHSMYNTRKMNVKTVLSLKLEGKKEVHRHVLSGYESDSIVECCKTQITSVPVHINASDVILFRETLDIPTGLPSAEDVLKCTARFTDRDFRLLSNKAVIRGNLIITVLYRAEDGTISKSEFLQPLTEITDAPGAEEDMKENIKATLSPFTAEITSNGDGNMRAFFVEGKIFTETNAFKCKTQEVITDMFCTDLPLDTQTASIPDGTCDALILVSQIRESIPSGNVRGVSDIIVRPFVEKTEISGGTVTVTGRADTELLCQNEKNEFFSLKKSIPFTCNGAFEGSKVYAEAEIINPSAEGANGNADVRFTVSVKAFPEDDNFTVCITDASPSENKTDTEKPSLTVYFTRKGDTLWSIAKTYSAPVQNIKSANRITDEITEGQRIIIPR